MKDARQILNRTRFEAMQIVDSQSSSIKSRTAWYWTHIGEIEMAYFLGLISGDEMNELEKEWRTHEPKTR